MKSKHVRLHIWAIATVVCGTFWLLPITDRTVSAQGQPSQQRRQPVQSIPAATDRFVLVGIVQDGDQFSAFLEPIASFGWRSISILHFGDHIGDAFVTEIQLDGIRYVRSSPSPTTTPGYNAVADFEQTKVALGGELRAANVGNIQAYPPTTPQSIVPSSQPSTARSVCMRFVQADIETVVGQLSRVLGLRVVRRPDRLMQGRVTLAFDLGNDDPSQAVNTLRKAAANLGYSLKQENGQLVFEAPGAEAAD